MIFTDLVLQTVKPRAGHCADRRLLGPQLSLDESIRVLEGGGESAWCQTAAIASIFAAFLDAMWNGNASEIEALAAKITMHLQELRLTGIDDLHPYLDFVVACVVSFDFPGIPNRMWIERIQDAVKSFPLPVSDSGAIPDAHDCSIVGIDHAALVAMFQRTVVKKTRDCEAFLETLTTELRVAKHRKPR